ncbi:unnamed protein product [Polarella glacialis]|uniref:Uncharacterized protein n=1 Tax=Polarella glacialis TaxID=89957 RepID=A0A813H9D7_POLGL|nr:unnamed protein product [Polarella glacialis]CAE8649463.1 unnamed protein product [Polarella glacialis]
MRTPHHNRDKGGGLIPNMKSVLLGACCGRPEVLRARQPGDPGYCSELHVMGLWGSSSMGRTNTYTTLIYLQLGPGCNKAAARSAAKQVSKSLLHLSLEHK